MIIFIQLPVVFLCNPIFDKLTSINPCLKTFSEKLLLDNLLVVFYKGLFLLQSYLKYMESHCLDKVLTLVEYLLIDLDETNNN